MEKYRQTKVQYGGGYLNNTPSTVFIYTKTHIESMCFLSGRK